MARALLAIIPLLFSTAVAFAAPDYQTEAASLPPMPAEPTIIGIRFSFYHGLRDLKQNVGWFNPLDQEHYLYRSTPQLAPNTDAVFEMSAKFYKRIHALYEGLEKTGEIARYARLSATTAEEGLIPVPTVWRAHLETAEQMRRATFGKHYELSRLFTILNKQLWDHRFVSTFFFTTIVDKRHRPLESMKSLSQGSRRAQELLERWMTYLTNQVAVSDRAILELSEAILNADVRGFDDRLGAAKVANEQTTLALSLLVDAVYRGVQFANDTVRRRNNSLEDLKRIAAELGDSLRTSIDEVNRFQHRFGRDKIPSQRADVLFDVNTELKKIYGLDAFYGGRSMSWEMQYRSPGFPEKVVKETAIMQHILTVAGLFASVAELPESRGGVGERLLQEYRYWNARLAKAKDSAEIVPVEHKFKALPSVQRRNFASPQLANKRAELEDEIWRIFFEHAGLEKESSAECVRLLTAPTGKIGN